MTNYDLAKLISEEDLQATIVELAQRTGWTVDWTPDWFWRLAFASMKRQRRGNRQWSPPGKPDLILVKPGQPGRLLFAELKSEKGVVRKPQRKWLDLLETVPGVEVYLWRPRHLVSGEIENVLNGESA